jgi:hypothetical protein
MIGVSRRLLFGIGALALFQTAVWAQSAPLVGDAYILPGNAGNTGGAITVNVGGALGYQGLFLFDLTKLPAGTTAANVSSASLRLFVNKVGAAGAINVYGATASWSESTVNGLSGGPLPGPLVAGPIGVSIASAYVAIPVTSQVQAWLNSAPNNGFLIQANPSTTSVLFDSKENTSTSHPAVLEVVLTAPAGATGAAGAPGPAGATGAAGTTGPVGPQGDTGATGAAGNAGAAGATGPQGPSGPAGAAGATGSQGSAGASGVAGAAGPTGPAGSTGATGAAGSAGAGGATGLRGNTGAQGSQGAQGATGPVGPQGLIQNNFAISSVQPPGTISSSLTQSVILLDNTDGINFTLPSAGSGTAGKDIWIYGNDFSDSANSMTIFAASGDELIVHDEAICSSCTNTSFGPVNYRLHVVSDGNHHWYAVQWD